MSFEEMAAWLGSELEAGRLTERQLADLLAQRTLFDRDRPMIEQEFPQRVVGYVAGSRLIADAVRPLLAQAASSFPSRMTYFESVAPRAP